MTKTRDIGVNLAAARANVEQKPTPLGLVLWRRRSMGRPRKRRPLGEAELDQRLTAGTPSLDRLCEWIRRCNPTGLPVDPTERRRRYALKARLQSELIERFGAHLRVRPTRDPNIVGIGRREGRGDGGHARLEDLSAPARAWVADALGHAALVPTGRSKHKPG